MRFDLDATGIGSVPFKDPKTACRIIFENFRSIPFWPQLPRLSFRENMYVQYSEGLPGVVLDDKDKTIYIDSQKALADTEGVYQKYLEQDLEFFKISKDHAGGFYAFLELFRSSGLTPKCVKGHVTGPVSYALFLTDQNKRSVIYDKDLFEVLTKVLVMKTRWQIAQLKSLCPDVVIFIDEPYLVSIGSSYVNIDVRAAMERLDEVVTAIREEGALCGIHCCGNTDWSLILHRDIDIINFDAYTFINEFSLYSDDLKKFLAKDKTIAFGIVPSSDQAEKESDISMKARLGSALKLLASKGIDTSRISSIVTPSCGVGSLDDAVAKKVFELTRNLSVRS